MCSEKQREANRLNALKSTGPRSAAGKAASRMNALKTGLHADCLVIAGESLEEFQTLVDEHYAQYRPVTPQYRTLVDGLVRLTWMSLRFDRVEAALYQEAAARLRAGWDPSQERKNDNRYARLRRVMEANTRALQRQIVLLKDITLNEPSDDMAARLDPESFPASQVAEPEAPTDPIGFVPATPASPPEAAPETPSPAPPVPPLTSAPSAAPR